MLSVCPSCKTQIEHEDFLFEVVCDKCRARFNPFMQQMDVPAESAAGLSPAGAEPSQLGETNSADNFAESNAVFEELQQFGETLQDPPEQEPVQSASKAAGKPSGGGEKVMIASDCAMTTGDTLQNQTIEAYLEPVSAWAELDSASSDPLKPAFEAIATAAKNLGGNGLVGLHWILASDNSKVLVSGIAVRIARS